ncbi:hypothetical protein [Tuberibacillus sp. Marseille-P3662]|nr:hypothetical protein [Tuberibacillus sp. Marseille-P3662]
MRKEKDIIRGSHIFSAVPLFNGLTISEKFPYTYNDVIDLTEGKLNYGE